MTTSFVPIYGELASFGAGATLVTFSRHVSYLSTTNRRRSTKYAAKLGSAYPIDLLGGGRAALAQPQLLFVYEILGDTATDVETAYNLIEAQLRATNTDGTSGEVNTLTIYLADGTTTATAPARFDDCSPNENDRGPYRLTARLYFTTFDDFHY